MNRQLQAIELKKEGKTHKEIMTITGYSRNALQKLLKKAGLTKPKHNWEKGIQVSKDKRDQKNKEEIDQWLEKFKEYKKKYPGRFWAFVLFHESEGAKDSVVSLVNKDWRTIKFAIHVLKEIDSSTTFRYRVTIHEERKEVQDTVLKFWANKLGIKVSEITITWRKKYKSKREYKEKYTGVFRLNVDRSTNLNRALHLVANNMLSLVET